MIVREMSVSRFTPSMVSDEPVADRVVASDEFAACSTPGASNSLLADLATSISALA